MKVLITGGTGLIGTEISRQLLDHGHEVVYLSRNPGRNKLSIKEYHWDPDRATLDEGVWDGVEAVINLAGAPIAQRWTAEAKSEILRSRVDSVRLLFNSIQRRHHQLKAFVSASAVGYYPHSYDQLWDERSAPGSDFLSMVCQKWEQEAQNFEELGIRSVRCRVGIVLSATGGALPEIARPVKWGVGAALGSGEQWLPWIHLSDVAAVFIAALEDERYFGAVNAVGPYNVTNRELTKAIAEALKKPFFMPKIPAFALKMALGEMSRTVLISNKVDNCLLKDFGFKYRYPKLEQALAAELKA